MSHSESPDEAREKQQVAGIFGRAAITYDHIGPRFFSYFGRRLVDIAQIPAGSKILDVATGRGALLFPASEAAGSEGMVIGIDISEQMVQETTKELVGLKVTPNVEVRQMDAEQLEFPDESFDYVLCGFAIFFFPQPSHALSEFRRVLKSNGHLCVSTWDKSVAEQDGWFDEIVKTYIPSEPEGNQQTESEAVSQPVFDTPEGLKAIMSAAGFAETQVFVEEADFVFATEEEFWSALWSHGVRRTLEKIEQLAGSDGLKKFKSEVIVKAGRFKQKDGLHQKYTVLISLAAKPLC